MTQHRSRSLYELKQDLDFLNKKKAEDRANWSCGEEATLFSYTREYNRRISRGELVVEPVVDSELVVEPVVDGEYLAGEDYYSDDVGD